jgi:hypothetical protein
MVLLLVINNPPTLPSTRLYRVLNSERVKVSKMRAFTL